MAAGNRATMGSSNADDDRTTVMSRSHLPLPSRRAPADVEDRTIVDMPRPTPRPTPSPRVATIEEQTSIGHVAQLAFPKPAAKMATPPASFGRATLLKGTRPMPAPPRPGATLAPSSTKSVRTVTPPPFPASKSSPPPPLVRAGHDSRTMVAAPKAAPLPPQSATQLHEALAPVPVAPRLDTPSEPPSAPVFVRDAMPSSPPAAPAQRARREPVLILAACAGLLGMIFTLGIVVGLVVSLRTKAQTAAQGVAAPQTVAAAAPLSIAPAPAVAVVAPVAAEPVATKAEAAVTPSPAKESPKTVEAPRPAPAPIKVAQHVAARIDAPPAPRPAPLATVAAAPAAKAKKHVAMPSDPDFDAANAANDLARAQLEASLH